MDGTETELAAESFATTLATHLATQGEPIYKFADRLGIARKTVYRLALGSVYVEGKGERINLDITLLLAISADTGIPVGTLAEDAAMAIVARRGE